MRTTILQLKKEEDAEYENEWEQQQQEKQEDKQVQHGPPSPSASDRTDWAESSRTCSLNEDQADLTEDSDQEENTRNEEETRSAKRPKIEAQKQESMPPTELKRFLKAISKELIKKTDRETTQLTCSILRGWGLRSPSIGRNGVEILLQGQQIGLDSSESNHICDEIAKHNFENFQSAPRKREARKKNKQEMTDEEFEDLLS